MPLKILIILSFVFYFCSTDSDTLVPLVSDKLTITIRESVTLIEAFDMLEERSLKIERIFGIHYVSTLPTDSIPYIIDIMNHKPYTRGTSGNVFISYHTHELTVLPTFTGGMDKDILKDWLVVVELLKLTEVPSFRRLKVRTPPNQAQSFFASLPETGMVENVEMRRDRKRPNRLRLDVER